MLPQGDVKPAVSEATAGSVHQLTERSTPCGTAHADLAPLYVKRVSFPSGECAPVLAGVKQTSLDTGCGPVVIKGRRELAGERIGLLAGARA